MYKEDIVIATISWARNEEEEKTLCASLTTLAALQVPVMITDGGSSASFVSFLKSFGHFAVFAEKGLWPQAKRSITEAAKTSAKMILYTEPDKQIFFQQYLPSMLETCNVDEGTGVVLASRSEAGFATFPSFQQMTETTINGCCREIIGKAVDYCYGPFLFHRQIIPALDALPDNCGWGWRSFLFAVAKRSGIDVTAFTGDFACPQDQREDNAAERVYRMKQLAQNIDGLVLAVTINL